MDEEKEAEIMSCKKLPSEIMVEILSRLPVKSLLRFRCVCKSWCSLVSDPSFVKLHLNRATEINKNSNIFLSISEGELLYCIEDYETCDEAIELNSPFDSSPFTHVDTVGSCNGLLCMRDRNQNPYFETYEDTIYLWNPATGEHKKLPHVPRTLPSHYRNHYTCLGFGYNLTTEKYKVVLISCALNYGEEESSCSHVYVYTLGTDEWRQLRNFPTKRLNSSSMAFDSLFVNERLHWFMDLNSNLGEKSIISFDLGDEEFRNLPLPDRRPGDEYCMTLGELGGCLSYSCVLVYNIVEIWVMKDYGVRESWTKQFIVDWPLVVGDNIDFCLDQVGVSKNGEILLNQDFEDLILYDPKTKNARDLMFRGIKPCTINRYAYHAYILACPFMWSLVSLSAESAKNGNGVERQ